MSHLRRRNAPFPPTTSSWLLDRWEGPGGDEPLPEDTEAAHRFARAAYYSSRLPQPSSQLEAVAGMFSVIRNAAQTFRIPNPGKPDASQTIWQTVTDLTNAATGIWSPRFCGQFAS